MSVISLGEQLNASGLQAFYNVLRLVRKPSQCSLRIHRLRKGGFLKDYLESNTVICLHLRSRVVPVQFYLVLHRIPFGYRHLEILDEPEDLNLSESRALYMAPNREADSVFRIGEFGQRTNIVV